MYDKIIDAETVIEAFTHAKTSFHANATRMALYTELQFDRNGRIKGSKYIDYILDQTRISHVKPNERAFHVFYYLIHGSSEKDKSSYGLNQASYEYLSKPESIQKLIGIDDSAQFDDLCRAMNSVGFGPKLSSYILQTISIILLIGNLNFEDPKDFTTNESASKVKNFDLAEHISNLLGIDPYLLENNLVYKSHMIGNEQFTMYLDSKKASEKRDSLASLIYSLLLKWMIKKINTCLNDASYTDDTHNIIGILDAPGFQNYTTNSLYEMVINYTNERIFHFLNHQIYQVGNADFESEGISEIIKSVKYVNNNDNIDLFIKPKIGIFPLIDKLSKENPKNKKSSSQNQNQNTAKDIDLVKSIYNNYPNYFGTKNPTSNNKFVVKHFKYNYNYSSLGFFDSNDQKIPIEFVNMFSRTEEEENTQNPFIEMLFKKSSIITEKNPHLKSEIIKAHQVLTPDAVPTSSLNHKTREKVKPHCNITMYHKSIARLICSLDETIPWVVFNIKPNEKMEPGIWSSQFVERQVEAFGIPNIALRKQSEFVASLVHSSFISRYSQILKPIIIDMNPQSDIQSIELLQMNLGWHKSDLSIGKTRVFLSFKAWKYLEYKANDLARLEQIENSGDPENIGEDMISIYTDDGVDQDSSFNNENSFDENIDPDLNEIEMKIARQKNHSNKDVYIEQNEIRDIESRANNLNHDNSEPILNPVDPPFDERNGSKTPTNAAIFADHIAAENLDEPKNLNTEKSDILVSEKGFFGSPDTMNDNSKPELDSALKAKLIDIIPDQLNDLEKPKKKNSVSRNNWLAIVWLVTWWVPSPMLYYLANLKRKDQQIAWREKFTLCVFIALCCALTIFWIAVLGILICPKQKIYTIEELQGFNSASNAMVAIRGEVFTIKDFNHDGVDYKYLVDNNYPGKDVSDKFPYQLSFVCSGLDIDARLSMSPKTELYSDAYFHDQRFWKNPNMLKTGGFNFYQYRVMKTMRDKYFKGHIGIPAEKVKQDSISIANSPNQKKQWAIINQEVFDLTEYFNHRGAAYVISPDGYSNDTRNRDFLDSNIQEMFFQYSGQDITERWERFFASNLELKKIYYNCLKGAFFAGIVDKRKSFQCYFANYIMLSSSIALTSIILFKFLAALQLGTQREPEENDKFVVCNVPCYTEGEESLKLTLESLATLRYDDKRKLLFIICDGMIMGSGNDRPTPRIVLDILGADPDFDCLPLSFQSLGDGSKQHNMGKVYSGLYEVAGHVVPYLVVAKCGTPKERFRQGNRGKRDSQIILMRFFNKVHFDLEMTPLELEIYHQIKNIIGVDPSFYEFVMMVDADTYVFPESLNRMVSCMVHDSKLMGICGETKLANEKDTWVTMIQVYEYYISHHLSKAFESLFGSVTCLPGCFSMYRLRASESEYPLLINNEVLRDYSENNVNTLHKKNLLSLGEDRYLTTLMLKHLPYYKMKFTPDAQCRTNAPDTWKVLLSQRRRWINSTVHNLLELVFLPRLCGFCCFSMRFIVFIDLFSTIIMPATVAYLAYLIYVLATWTSDIPVISISLLVSVYAMQVLLFIIKKQWQHIGWMIVYFFAIPVFSFFIPVYSFWHFDDFSWGNTRVVVGDGQKKKFVEEEQDFDPTIIPTRKWAEYEEEAMNEIKNIRYGSENPFSNSNSEVTNTSRGYSPSNNGSVYSSNFNWNSSRNNPMLFMHNGNSSNNTNNNNFLSGSIRNDSYEGRIIGNSLENVNFQQPIQQGNSMYNQVHPALSQIGHNMYHSNNDPNNIFSPNQAMPQHQHQLLQQQQQQQQILQQQLHHQHLQQMHQQYIASSSFNQPMINQSTDQHEQYMRYLAANGQLMSQNLASQSNLNVINKMDAFEESNVMEFAPSGHGFLGQNPTSNQFANDNNNTRTNFAGGKSMNFEDTEKGKNTGFTNIVATDELYRIKHAVLSEIRKIVDESDLLRVTKKQIKESVEFNCSLDGEIKEKLNEFINENVDAAISEKI
ncbi:Chitin synthase 8 [Smittium culicis]|uniref:chitin synthase n=1 Tax=Smittium culicis TaxID=133412 RepID=A0A1R1YTJ1_9FUNG|nr:Chitin synthase 8 [Smittium culicis]